MNVGMYAEAIHTTDQSLPLRRGTCRSREEAINSRTHIVEECDLNKEERYVSREKVRRVNEGGIKSSST